MPFFMKGGIRGGAGVVRTVRRLASLPQIPDGHLMLSGLTLVVGSLALIVEAWQRLTETGADQETVDADTIAGDRKLLLVNLGCRSVHFSAWEFAFFLQ